ncbi:hypothetical protein [Diaphorobacter caeni]|uniref:hypothetical protein n=1 Tax=Diaphorobacter caeni TaxID=2784387 RepID=UPI001890554B|nr:hypothetical protein [Diaphorobacter caeni]MBF5007653.1 hypothetical protein [Diaphorobacter caeni]
MHLPPRSFRGLLAAPLLWCIAFTAAAQPVLTCNDASTTPSVIHRSQVWDVVNTYAAGFNDGTTTYPTNNQMNWSAGTEFDDSGGDLSTGVLTAASPYGYNAPPAIPSFESGWIALGGTTLAPWMVGLNGSDKPNVNPNVMYYYLYQFNMDPQADPAQFGMTFGDYAFDDRVKGIYLNGTLIQTTSDPSSLTATIASLSLLPPTANFQAGLNEIVIAILNIGDPANPPLYLSPIGNPSITALRLGRAQISDCTPPPTASPPLPPVPPGGMLTSNSAISYAGTVTNWGTATTVDVYVQNVDTSQLSGPYVATIDPITGTYTYANAPNLPAGHYLTQALMTIPITDPVRPGRVAISEIGEFFVAGLTMAPPANVDTATPATISGQILYHGSATTVNVTVTNTDTLQSFGPYPAAIQPDGSYSVNTALLPAGSYTAVAAIAGAADLQVTGNFTVNAAPVTGITVTPPPTLDPTQSPNITGQVTHPGTATTVSVIITNPASSQTYGPFVVPIQPDGSYGATSAPLPPGSYTVTATANGASATGSFAVVGQPVTQAATPVTALHAWALALLSGLLAVLGWSRMRGHPVR